MNALIVIQARLRSTRLPGKVLEKIGDLTVLEHVYQRCKLAGESVVCIPHGAAIDAPVPQLIAGPGIRESDVLSRFFDVLAASSPDYLVRITSDCPFVRPEDIRAVLGALVLSGSDYAWNVGEPRQCPDGYDVEAFTWTALTMAYAAAADPVDREHVTPWMRRNLNCIYVPTHDGMGHYRWTLDTAADLAWMRGVAAWCDTTPGVGPTQQELTDHALTSPFPGQT